MRRIEEHDEEDGEEPPDVCMLSPHPLLFLALAPAHARGGAAFLEEFSSLGQLSKKFVVTLSAGGGQES